MGGGGMISPTSDYLSFLMTLPHVTLMSLMTFFFLGLIRIAPIIFYAPFLGGSLPGPVKMGIALSFTFMLLPQIIQNTSQPLSFDMNFIAYSLKELFVGSILGFLSLIPFYIAESAGSLIDFMRGSASLQVTDPYMQTQTSTIGNFFVLIQAGGLFLFLDALAYSFQILPIDRFFKVSFFYISMPFWKLVFGLGTRILATATQLAAPSLVAILMAEMFSGIANRLAPQVQIVFLGMSLKSLLGLGLLWTAWALIMRQMDKQPAIWLRDLEKVLTSFGF